MNYKEVPSGFGSNINAQNLAFGKLKVWKLVEHKG
jgi:hypothetical protein